MGNDQRGDWELIVKANGEQVLRKTVSNETTTDGWMHVDVDLSRYAGKTIELELVNQPTGWAWEAGHWAEIRLLSE